MATLNKQKTATTSDLLICKMLQSKMDGRLAFINKIEGDFVFLEMDNVGERKFHIEVINKGFGFILDNFTMIKAFFYNRYSPSSIFDEQGLYLTSCEIYDILSGKYSDLTNQDVYQALKKIAYQINVKSGL